MIIIALRSGLGVYPEQSIMSAREAIKNVPWAVQQLRG